MKIKIDISKELMFQLNELCETYNTWAEEKEMPHQSVEQLIVSILTETGKKEGWYK